MAEKVTLSISPIAGFPGNYRVNIGGSGFTPNKDVNWRLRGEDTFIDDNIAAPRGGGRVAPDGTFGFEANAISGNLNEDWGTDEVYAVAYYPELRPTYHKSNVVKANF